MSFHFQLEQNTLGTLSVPTNKNLKDWGRANVIAVTRRIDVCGHVLIWIFFLVFWLGTPSWNLSKHFRYLPVQRRMAERFVNCKVSRRKWVWPKEGNILVFSGKPRKRRNWIRSSNDPSRIKSGIPQPQVSDPTATLNCLVLMINSSVRYTLWRQ